MTVRHHQHETILAERVGRKRAGIDGGGDNAQVGNPFRKQADNLVAEPLLEIDADAGMGGEERAQRLGKKLGERIGVGQNPDLPGETAGIGAQILAQPLCLAQDHACMRKKGATCLCRCDALAAPQQQCCAQGLLHVANAGRGGRERKVRALGPPGDAARFHDMAKQPEIGQIETHGILLIRRRKATRKTYCRPEFRQPYS